MSRRLSVFALIMIVAPYAVGQRKIEHERLSLLDDHFLTSLGLSAGLGFDVRPTWNAVYQRRDNFC